MCVNWENADELRQINLRKYNSISAEICAKLLMA